LNANLSIPNARIRDSSVDAGTPNLAAAPSFPATFPRLSRNVKRRLVPPAYDAARFTVGDTPLTLSVSLNY
jgi:hypothetical protein